MSKNKSVDVAVGIINKGGFKKGQMCSVLAEKPDWLSEKLQGSLTDKEFFKAWTDPHIATCGIQAEIVMTPDAFRRRNLFRMCLQKTPSGFVHKCVRGWGALRINGLLKRKCKKGARRNYPTKPFY